MFHNPFRKDSTPAAAGPDGTPAESEAQSAHGLSAAETQVWRDRILAAGADDAALLQLAREAPSTELKVAALRALTQEDSFRVAMDEYRGRDKRLYRTVKSRWDAARAKRATGAEAGALIAGARSLLDQKVVPANRVAELDRAWAAVSDAGLAPELGAEFAALREQLGARMRERSEGEQALTGWLKATEEAIDKLTASLPGVAQGSVPPDEAEALAAGLLELLASGQDTGDARRSTRTDAVNRALALASSVVERAKFLQSLPAPGAADEAGEKLTIEQWRGFPEVSEGELQTVLATRFADWRKANAQERQLAHDAHRAHERQQTAEQHQRHSSAVERDVEAAEAAQAGGHVADLARLLAAIDQALKRGPVNAALKQRIDSLHREHLRLRHWQRWGGGQRREELAAEAQELARAAAGKVSIQEHAAAITKLRERWKELDKLGGASRQAVWLTFDGALKTAYAPVAAHLDKLKRARDENLAARNRIVDGLVQAAAKLLPPNLPSPDHVAQGANDTPGAPTAPTAPAAPATSTDWRAIGRTLEEAQVAWRKLGPVEHTVPRKALQGDKAVTSRYAAAVQALEGPLQNTHGEARRQREQLIANAKDLAGSDVAARDVVDKVRRLQTQWQAVARAMPLPRRDEETLWKAFKTATDAIFAARDAGRAAKEAEFSGRIKAREEIIERLAALPAASAAPDIKRAMVEADTAWRAAPELPRPQASKLDARYRAAREAATKRIGEIAARASQARFDALIAVMALCHEREAAEDSGRALTEEEASDLEARWNAIEDIPQPWKSRLEARFRDGKAAGRDLPDLLLNLEVALGMESPAEFQAARQRLKILALKTAMEGRQATVTTPADIERWLLDAASTPRPDEVSRERMGKIVAAVRRRA
ncbi:MAG TPA: DUF349 domain-containing protein [Burkholderiales bacterium]|nr:DUF349 domain-containing protein [Burkholderiales bacterium]